MLLIPHPPIQQVALAKQRTPWTGSDVEVLYRALLSRYMLTDHIIVDGKSFPRFASSGLKNKLGVLRQYLVKQTYNDILRVWEFDP
jgi:hypothetical protein